MMPRDAEHEAPAPGVAESRAHRRVTVHSLAYIELAEANAGLILNISETGMAVQAVQMLTSAYLPQMQFRLPKTDALIEASGKVVWQIRPKKEAGIEFDGLSDQARQTIRRWIAEEENQRAESEQGRLRTLSEPVRPASDHAILQIYPSERGDEGIAVATALGAPASPTDVASALDASTNRAEIAPAFTESGEKQTDNQTHSADKLFNVPESTGPVPPIFPAPPMPRRVPERWRPDTKIPEPVEAAPQVTPTRRLHQPVGAPGWNPGRVAPGVLIDPERRRPWWQYVAAIGLLAAVGYTGVTALDPGAITPANMESFVARVTASLQQAQQPASASRVAQTSSASAKAAVASSGAQIHSQTQGSTNTTQNAARNATTNPQSSVAATSGSVPPGGGQIAANDASPGSATTPSTAPVSSGAYPQSNSAAPSAVAASGLSGASRSSTSPPLQTRAQAAARTEPYSHPAVNGTARELRDSQPASAGNEYARNNANGSRYASGSPYTASPQTEQARRVQGEANSSPARSAQSDQSALAPWREQTKLPPASGSASSSASGAANRTPARQQNAVQDAYANSAPYAPAHPANTPKAPYFPPPPEAAIVEMPGYPSAPVPPSMPLVGVPSGSVAATSQFRAIWIPSSLTWARQYLPGNLGVGELASSYSPAYPIEAAREGIQGTVKLDVMVTTDGTVRSVRVLSGPAVLSSAAVSAARDWRYDETFLAGEPIETEQYITMVFTLTPAR
jgi:TonB family protein